VIVIIIHHLNWSSKSFPTTCFINQINESTYSEEQEPRELAGSCCTFKCMISRVKQQLGGSDLHNSTTSTPWGYLSFNRTRSPIEIHPFPLYVVYAASPLLANLPRLFLPHWRNRYFTYVYNVPLQATTAHSPSLTVQSHDDKSDSTPTSDSRFVCADCNALVNQWVPRYFKRSLSWHRRSGRGS